MRAKVEPELGEKARGAIERVDDADMMLARPCAHRRGRLDLNDDEREQADLLKASASTRRAMLDRTRDPRGNASAASALPLAIEGGRACSRPTGSRTSGRGLQQAHEGRRPEVPEAQRTAPVLLDSRRERSSPPKTAFPAAPFEEYLEYVERPHRHEQAVAALRRGVARRTTCHGANKIIGEYNKQDKRAVALAKELPTSPEQAIAEAYTETTKELTDEYYAAREKALAADKALREH